MMKRVHFAITKMVGRRFARDIERRGIRTTTNVTAASEQAEPNGEND